MLTQHKAAGRASSLPAGLAAGAAISVLTMLMICLVGAWLISAEILAQQQIGYCMITALVTGAMLGAGTAWRKIKRQKLLVCLMSGGVYFGILALITIVFFGGDFRGAGVTLVSILLGTLASFFLMNEHKNLKIGKKHRKRIR